MKKNSLRVFSCLMAVLTTLCLIFTVVYADEASPETEINKADYYSRLGDMNEDWMLNSADARVILRLCARLDWEKDPGWLPKGAVFGDIGENGILNSADARWALRVSARLNTVPEVIQMDAELLTKPAATKPAEPSSSSDSSSTTAPTTVTTTQVPTTTNPNYVELPICDDMLLELKTADNKTVLIATDGLSFYVKSDEIAGSMSVFIDRDGKCYLLNDSDKEYAPMQDNALKAIGVDLQKVRKYAAGLFIPDLDTINDYEGFKTGSETIEDIPYTVATKGKLKVYYYADGSILKVNAPNYADKAQEYTVSQLDADPSSYLDILNQYKEINSNLFIIKNGLDFISSLG